MKRVLVYKTLCYRYDVPDIIVEVLRKIDGDDDCDITQHPLAIEFFDHMAEHCMGVIDLSTDVVPEATEISIIGKVE